MEKQVNASNEVEGVVVLRWRDLLLLDTIDNLYIPLLLLVRLMCFTNSPNVLHKRVVNTSEWLTFAELYPYIQISGLIQ
jgi:hypothetical protein